MTYDGAVTLKDILESGLLTVRLSCLDFYPERLIGLAVCMFRRDTRSRDGATRPYCAGLPCCC